MLAVSTASSPRLFETNVFVDALAFRIAKWLLHAVALAKESVSNVDLPWAPGIARCWKSNCCSSRAMRRVIPSVTKQRLRKFMELGAHSRDGETRCRSCSSRSAGRIAVKPRSFAAGFVTLIEAGVAKSVASDDELTLGLVEALPVLTKTV